MFVAVLVVATLIVGFSYYLFRKVTYPKVISYEETFQYEAQKNNIDIEAFNKRDKIEVFLNGHGNHKIHGYLIRGKEKKTVIICHGYTLSLASSIKYADMFIDRGYSVLLYDHRNHGLSSGSFTSFGFYESEDLKHIIENLRMRDGGKSKIGLLGESLGGATVLQYIAKFDDVDFVIADCPFSDAVEIFEYRMSYDYKMRTKIFVGVASALSKLLQGWSFRQASVVGKMKHVKTPVLFIHGDKDKFVPKHMTEALYEEKDENKWIYIAPEARHVGSFQKDPATYRQEVYAFLDTIQF